MLEFDPGTSSLRCGHCGTMNTIDRLVDAPRVEELDLTEHLSQLGRNAETAEVLMVRCDGCGAEQTLQKNVTAAECVFCGKAIVAQAVSKRLIKPQSLLPFKIPQADATQRYRDWIASRWFAPSALKRKAQQGRIFGSYIPAWTYDADTTTPYRGQRGEDYYVTQTYTVTVNGQTQTRTRQVKHTRWYPASGTVTHFFNDVLVLATTSLPESCANALDPWDLENLAPFDERYISGFVAEAYHIDLPTGWSKACSIMDSAIKGLIRSDIGGDHQRIDWYQTRHSDMTFKHLLLPVWISAYQYHDKSYIFLVNGRTGEVQGQRPYSWIKITAFVVTILAIVAALVVMFNK